MVPDGVQDYMAGCCTVVIVHHAILGRPRCRECQIGHHWLLLESILTLPSYPLWPHHHIRLGGCYHSALAACTHGKPGWNLLAPFQSWLTIMVCLAFTYWLLLLHNLITRCDCSLTLSPAVTYWHKQDTLCAVGCLLEVETHKHNAVRVLA